MALTTLVFLAVRGLAPEPAHAIDLFPVDDWIGDGLKHVGKIALGPLKFTAKGLAHLLGGLVAALADLLIPKSLVKAGVRAIRWLVELPPLGTSPRGPDGTPSVSMPHLRELRDVLTWIGLTLLPLQLVVSGGRAFLSPVADRDSPTEVLQRTLGAAAGLICFDWMWSALTELVRLITSTLLSLPWVADGVRRMLQALVIGGASGTAVAAEFVVPLILTVAGAALLALMLLRIGLEVIASIVFVTGGLALGLSVSSVGHRLLQAWLVAATAVFVLPVLWTVVFVVGAALMVDAGSTGGHGFGDFVGQLYNVGAAIVVFGVAIKLARATLGHASTAITGIAATARFSGMAGARFSRASSASPTAAAIRTPQSLARFSQGLRGAAGGAAVGLARVGAFPMRHPAAAAAYMRQPVQAAREATEQVASTARERARRATHRGSGVPQQEEGAGTAGRSNATRKEPHRPDKRDAKPQRTSEDASPSSARPERPSRSGQPPARPGMVPAADAKPSVARRVAEGSPPAELPRTPADPAGPPSSVRPSSTASPSPALPRQTTWKVVTPPKTGRRRSRKHGRKSL